MEDQKQKQDSNLNKDENDQSNIEKIKNMNLQIPKDQTLKKQVTSVSQCETAQRIKFSEIINKSSNQNQLKKKSEKTSFYSEDFVIDEDLIIRQDQDIGTQIQFSDIDSPKQIEEISLSTNKVIIKDYCNDQNDLKSQQTQIIMKSSYNENVDLSISSKSAEGEVLQNLSDEVEQESVNEDLLIEFNPKDNKIHESHIDQDPDQQQQTIENIIIKDTFVENDYIQNNLIQRTKSLHFRQNSNNNLFSQLRSKGQYISQNNIYTETDNPAHIFPGIVTQNSDESQFQEIKISNINYNSIQKIQSDIFIKEFQMNNFLKAQKVMDFEILPALNNSQQNQQTQKYQKNDQIQMSAQKQRNPLQLKQTKSFQKDVILKKQNIRKIGIENKQQNQKILSLNRPRKMFISPPRIKFKHHLKSPSSQKIVSQKKEQKNQLYNENEKYLKQQIMFQQKNIQIREQNIKEIQQLFEVFKGQQQNDNKQLSVIDTEKAFVLAQSLQQDNNDAGVFKTQQQKWKYVVNFMKLNPKIMLDLMQSEISQETKLPRYSSKSKIINQMSDMNMQETINKIKNKQIQNQKTALDHYENYNPSFDQPNINSFQYLTRSTSIQRLDPKTSFFKDISRQNSQNYLKINQQQQSFLELQKLYKFKNNSRPFTAVASPLNKEIQISEFASDHENKNKLFFHK